jgi:hypothetical protein
MKKVFLALALVGAFANANAYWQCYANNNAGFSFYGTGATQFQASNNAMFACRTNTPFGYYCVVTSTCDWFNY